VLQPCQRKMLARGTEDKEHAMSQKLNGEIAVIGIDIGKNSTLSAKIGAEPCCYGRSGRAARWKRGSPICRRA